MPFSVLLFPPFLNYTGLKDFLICFNFLRASLSALLILMLSGRFLRSTNLTAPFIFRVMISRAVRINTMDETCNAHAGNENSI
jgi:hypothetical protein